MKFEAMLRENAIPPRPAALEAVTRELRGDAPDLNVLERALRQDVAIAGGLVKMANSSYFGLRRHVRSVRETLEVLGLRTAAQLVACVALRGAFPKLQLDRFWDASAKVAALSAWLVNRCNWRGIDREDAYTFGLFRDCGIAVLMQRIPSYRDVLRLANEESTESFTDVERRVLPIAHTQVGAMLTQTWWLPDDLTEAIRVHHDVQSITTNGSDLGLSPQSGMFIAVSQLAEYLFQSTANLSANKEWGKLGHACMSRLLLAEAEVQDLQQETAEAMSSL